MSDKCKFCGAEIAPTGRYIDIKHTHYACGTIYWATTGEWSRDTDCFRRQLQQSEERAKELFDALSSYDNVKQDSVWRKHAEYFRKEAR